MQNLAAKPMPDPLSCLISPAAGDEAGLKNHPDYACDGTWVCS